MNPETMTGFGYSTAAVPAIAVIAAPDKTIGFRIPPVSNPTTTASGAKKITVAEQAPGPSFESTGAQIVSRKSDILNDSPPCPSRSWPLPWALAAPVPMTAIINPTKTATIVIRLKCVPQCPCSDPFWIAVYPCQCLEGNAVFL